jgi:hypothetical protein
MPISKGGIPLTTLTAWETHAGPKSPNQWVDGRSAKEAARAWLESGGTKLPEEVSSALINHKAFGPVQSWQAEPEAKLSFDSFAGGPRNSDLVVYAQDSHGPFLIAVEAKADEPFGKTVAETLAAAVDRYLENNRSNGVARTEQLAAALLGPRQSGDPLLKDIRYQLLTACAGALCEAQRRGYSRALMLVQEFVTVKTSDDKHSCNGADLDTFVKRLSHGSVSAVRPGGIYGPFTVPGAPLLSPGVALFVGKVSRNLRTSGA